MGRARLSKVEGPQVYKVEGEAGTIFIELTVQKVMTTNVTIINEDPNKFHQFLVENILTGADNAHVVDEGLIIFHKPRASELLEQFHDSIVESMSECYHVELAKIKKEDTDRQRIAHFVATSRFQRSTTPGNPQKPVESVFLARYILEDEAWSRVFPEYDDGPFTEDDIKNQHPGCDVTWIGSTSIVVTLPVGPGAPERGRRPEGNSVVDGVAPTVLTFDRMTV